MNNNICIECGKRKGAYVQNMLCEDCYKELLEVSNKMYSSKRMDRF